MSLYQTITVTGRSFIVGDLHGCYSLLENVLEQLEFSPENGDVCILVGDLTDRGNESLNCLTLLDEKGFYSIQGNHEQMMITALQGQELGMYCWLHNGGQWYQALPEAQQQEIKTYWLPKIQTLPYAIDLHTAAGLHIGICHADPVVNDWAKLLETLEQENAASNKELLERMVWARERITLANKVNYLSDAYQIKGIDWCVMGHTPVRPTPLIKGNCVWIDSGAVYPSGYLTVLEPDKNMQYYHSS